MTAAADGDRDAVEPLFHALWPLCASFAERFVGDRVLAEDCVQEALVKLFGQLDRFDRSRDALSWALTHVTWACRTARRRRGRSKARTGTAIEETIDGRMLVEERELVRVALAQVSTLSSADIEIIGAMLVDDDSVRDALAPATFRKRLERALTRLRDGWRSRHGI